MTDPLSPPPVRDYRPEYLPAYLSNGLVGLRCPRIPFRGGTAIVNGFAGLDPADGVEGFARAPFPLAADVTVDGVRLSYMPHLVEFVEQRYDFSVAELTTVLKFHLEGATARIEVVQLCSHTQPTVVCQEMTVTVDRAAEVSVSVGADPSGVPGHGSFQTKPAGPPTDDGPDGILVWTSNGDVAECALAYRADIEGATEPQRTSSPRDETGMMSTTFTYRARKGTPVHVHTLTSLVPSLVHPHPADQASRLLAGASRGGWRGLRAEHRLKWADLWRSRIELDGAPRRWQAIADASLFWLLTSVHPSSIASTSLFGLAYWPNYHYYRGHVMWDIETFAVPPLLLLEPPAARAILDYRSRHLEAARVNARLSGWLGASFPWESCPMHGEEATPGATAPTKEHATLDVALAFASYCHASGDVDYLRRIAWPVIQAVAEWTESRAMRSPRGYEIRGTTGPAEVEPPFDNDAFVNMSAAQLLREATGFADQLGMPPRRRWSEIADGLTLPMAARGHLANHDGYRLDEPKGGTPEGAAGIFPVGYRVSPAVERATFRFAVEEQAPSYVGTPMLSAFLAYYAASLGLRDRSEELLESGYGTFVNDPWLEIDEFPRTKPEQPRCGPMFANIGGFLTTLLYGYPGLRLGSGTPDTWCDRPVVLPGGWRGIHVERLFVRGDEMSLSAEAGKPAAILDGKRPRKVA